MCKLRGSQPCTRDWWNFWSCQAMQGLPIINKLEGPSRWYHLADARTEFFFSETVCTHNGDMLQENAVGSFEALFSLILWHNTFLHICISMGLTTLADDWSCGLLLFATRSSLGTLPRCNSSWVCVPTASLWSQQQCRPSLGTQGDPSAGHSQRVPTEKGQQCKGLCCYTAS